jgi:hypothetical protein
MYTNHQNFSFCTLALGTRYRSHACLLAQDIAKHSPSISLIILTDEPQDFIDYPHVLAFKHRQQSIGCYHDKRFVIAKALSLFNTCMFVDADIRILAPFSADIKWLPGITARSCSSIVKHNEIYMNSVDTLYKRKRIRELEVLGEISQKLNLALEDPSVQFVMEMLFVVTKQDGREIEFIKHWETIAHYCELNGFYGAEGYAMGLAAAKAGLTVRWDEMTSFVYFKDWVEKQKIKKGQATIEKTLIYFRQHEAIEYRRYSILEKINRKINQIIGFYCRYFYLKIKTLKNFDFYYKNYSLIKILF